MQKPADRSRGVLARVRALSHLRLIAATAVAAVFAITAIGAGATPVGPTPVSDVLGLTGGGRGEAVSNAAHEAKEGLEDGDKVGPAVSEAVCKVVTDRSNMPQGAQDAPGQQGRTPRDCTHPSNATDDGEGDDEGATTADADAEDGDGEEELNHGQTVSKAVHDAKASLEEGQKVGPAVSQAACTAAHDRSTLPQGAQDAPGQQGRTPKDCTHPSNAGDDEDVGEAGSQNATGGGARGKDSAPGQQKKNR